MSTESSTQPQVLAYILNSMAPATLVSRLRMALDPAMGYSSEDIQSLIDGLANVGFGKAVAQAEKVVANEEQAQELHCVRCHKSYKEILNGIEACTLTHTYPFTAPSFSSLSLPSSAQCQRCEQTPPPSAVVEKPCVAARHTTNAKDIGRSSLVRSCETIGCFLEKKKIAWSWEGTKKDTTLVKNGEEKKETAAKDEEKPITKLPFSFAQPSSSGSTPSSSMLFTGSSPTANAATPPTPITRNSSSTTSTKASTSNSS